MTMMSIEFNLSYDDEDDADEDYYCVDEILRAIIIYLLEWVLFLFFWVGEKDVFLAIFLCESCEGC